MQVDWSCSHRPWRIIFGMFKDYADPTVKGEKKQWPGCRWTLKIGGSSCGRWTQIDGSLCLLFAFLWKGSRCHKSPPRHLFRICSYKSSCWRKRDISCSSLWAWWQWRFSCQGIFDVAARAVAKLKDEERSFKLVFVGAPNGEEEKVKERFLKEGISPSQLCAQCKGKRRAWWGVLSTWPRSRAIRPRFSECAAIYGMMLSRTEGFGLAAVEGLFMLVFLCWLVVLAREVPSGWHCVHG